MSQIVYVEDDPINAFVFERLLKDIHDVTHFETGEACLDDIQSLSPSVVFMDINLGQGKLDGIETMHKIKEMEGFNQIPIIAITAFAFEEDERRFLDAGFDFYVAKPVSRDQLKDIISKFDSE